MTEDGTAGDRTDPGRSGVVIGTADTAGSVAPTPGQGGRRSTRQWPLLVVLAGVAIGLGVVAVGAWRLGCVIIGAAFAIGAVERIALPRRQAGLLRVRGRAFDIAAMLGIAVAVIVLAAAVPEGRR